MVGTLDDAEILTSAARAADAVIHAASAHHSGSVVTLVTALERSGKLLINTTGSAIVADHADGAYAAEVPLTEDSYFDYSASITCRRVLGNDGWSLPAYRPRYAAPFTRLAW